MVLDGLTGESVPFAANEQDLRDAGSERKSDEWVRDSALSAEPPRTADSSSRAMAFGAAMTVDLSAERSSCGSDDVELRAAVSAGMVLVGQRDRAAPAHVGRLRRQPPAF